MSLRIFILTIFMGMTMFLVWNNYQETGSISESINRSWNNVVNAEIIKEAKKAWQKTSRQAATTINKFKDGRLTQEAIKFVDKITMVLFQVKTPDLLATLQKYEKTWLDGMLLVVWAVMGYLCYSVLSPGVTLFTMAVSVLVHSLYGPAWCMYELVILFGLVSFLISVITNNAVFTAFLLSGCYTLYALWRFVGPSDGHRLDRIESRITLIQHELNDLAKQLAVIEDKVDLVRSSQRDSK